MASAAPSNGSCLCIFLADAVDMQHQIEKLLIITAPILLLLQESRNFFSTDICFRVIIGQHLYHAATPRFALSTAHQPLDEIADMHREPVVTVAVLIQFQVHFPLHNGLHAFLNLQRLYEGMDLAVFDFSIDQMHCNADRFGIRK